MRNLFLMLVLANLAFAAWHSWFAAPAPLQRATDSDIPTIMLASELPGEVREIGTAPAVEEAPAEGGAANADERPAPDAEVAAIEGEDALEPPAPPGSTRDAAIPAAAKSCVSVGPFRELSQAATAAANLRGSGFDPVQRAGEGDVWVGYWVYLAAIPTVTDANAILARLRESGISDSYVIPNSDSGNLVSLGVFSEITRAGNRLTEVRTLGLEATIADRTRRATVYWVDVMLAEGQALDFDLLQPPGRILRLEQRPCAQR